MTPHRKFKYPHLLATLLIVVSVLTLLALNVITPPRALGLLLLGQCCMIAVSRPRAACFVITLTQEQVDEFSGIIEEIGDDAKVLKQLKDAPQRLKSLETENNELRGKLRNLTKATFAGTMNGGSSIRTIGGVDFIPDEAARQLAATFVLGIFRHQEAAERYFADAAKRQSMKAAACSILGLPTEFRATSPLDSTTTPLPTIYTPAIIELVWKYGQARQFATVFPLGAGTVKLPRLKAGEDSFGYLGVGTAGMSQAVPKKQVTAELVTFTANKLGGLIQIPTEIEEDTFIPLGQFLARYIARQFAKMEDATLFLGDGSATYANITGIGPYCAANVAYLQQLAATKTKPTDAVLSDFRSMRGKVNAAVYADDPAYYMNPTMESLLSTFNTIGSPLIYRPAVGTQQPATLDGFPIRWTGVLQPFATTAAASTYLAFFGALRYWYLGERGAPRVEISREVYFATDELAMRALERIDVEAMAVDAMSALQTAAV